MSFSFRTQQTVAPYRLWLGAGGVRYLLHGQRTPGHNNGVPVKSVAEAKQIAAAWRESGIPAPFDPLDASQASRPPSHSGQPMASPSVLPHG